MRRLAISRIVWPNIIEPLTMTQPTDTDLPLYLTTREVAEMLRVKERKVYDLAAENGIPHLRVTGKLLFPRADVLAWMGDPRDARATERPLVVAGSHDPLLDWAIRESACGLPTLYDGSADGLDRFLSGAAAVAGLHLPDTGGWNANTVAARAPANAVLIGWALRQRGILTSDASIQSFPDLQGRSVVRRQSGAGAAAVFDQLLDGAAFGLDDLPDPGLVARTEADAAAAVASGEADAALGLEAMARPHGLRFVPLVTETFDLLIDRRAYFTPPVQALLAFAATDAFLARAASLGGYDTSILGSVRWVGL